MTDVEGTFVRKCKEKPVFSLHFAYLFVLCLRESRLHLGKSKKYGDLYIVCGPVLLNREHETIGVNKVVVPEAFFKVILRMNPQPAAIGFIIRNNEGKKKKGQFVNTIDDVERITGMDFFPSLPDSVEDKVEAYSNLEDWK